jgi:predicted transport protein
MKHCINIESNKYYIQYNKQENTADLQIKISNYKIIWQRFNPRQDIRNRINFVSINNS